VPLKDLTVNTAELTEKWIEEIISPYVKFDVTQKRVVFLPEAAKLPVKPKVLVFLVALQGWPFVSEEGVPTSAKPAQIEESLNIQGGTLRPALKELKDSNFVSVSGQSYSVSPAALPAIKEVVEKRANGVPGSRNGTSSRSRKSARSSSSKATSGASSQPSKNAEFLNRQVAEGFFDEPKVLADVVQRFHEYGLTVQKGTISPLLLKAVRAEKLQRKKVKAEKGKEVWTYESVTK
jgi:hypothetical protein